MDSTSSTNYEQPPILPVAEMYPTSSIGAAVEQRYEPYSIAATLQVMFAEAETMVDQRPYWETEHVWEREYPNDTEAFRMFMKEVQSEIKHSGAVQALKSAVDHGGEISESMIEAVFRAYERSVQTATKRLRETLSSSQIAQLQSAARSQLDRGYRDLLVEYLTHAEGAPVRYAPEDFFLILNPKARKVQYMERQEILKSLRNTMSLGTKEQLKRDVDAVRRFEPSDVVLEQVMDEDLAEFES